MKRYLQSGQGADGFHKHLCEGVSVRLNLYRSLIPRMRSDIGEQARALVPGWDIYYVKDAFAAWWVKLGSPAVERPDGLFLKFCRTFYEKKVAP